MKYLLDTHTVIWALMGDGRLGKVARRRIAGADPEDLCISGVTLFEVAMLVEKKRVRLKGTLQGFLEGIESRLAVLPMDSRIAADAVTLELPEGDPFDRLIVATARRHGLELLSRDKTISKSGLVNVVW